MPSAQTILVRVFIFFGAYFWVMPTTVSAQLISGQEINANQKNAVNSDKERAQHKTIVYLNGPDINNITRETLYEHELEVPKKNRNSRFILPRIIGGYASFLDKFKYMEGAISEGEPFRVYFEFTVNEIGVIESVEFDADTDLTTQTMVIQALTKVRFSPAIKDGRFIKVKLSHQLVLYK